MSKLSLILVLIVLLAIVEMGSTDKESNESLRNNSKPKKDVSGKGKSEESKIENSSDDTHNKSKHSDEHRESHESDNISVDSNEDDFNKGKSSEERNKDKDVDHGHDDKYRNCIKGDDKCPGRRNYTKLQYIVKRNSMYAKCPKERENAPCISMKELCNKKYKMHFSSTPEIMKGSVHFICDCDSGNHMIMETTQWKNDQYHTSIEVYRIEKMVNSTLHKLTTTDVANNGEALLHEAQIQFMHVEGGIITFIICSQHGTHHIDQMYGAGEETILCKRKNSLGNHCAMCNLGHIMSVLRSQYNMTTLTESKQIC